MKRTAIDYSASLLSAFDIGGSLLLNNFQTKGMDHDINQLMKDQNRLAEDYKNAFDKITKDEGHK